MSAPANASQAATKTVKTAAEAAALVTRFDEVVDKLHRIVQQETELVRAGRLRAADAFATTKAELTRLYVADMLALRASRQWLAHLAPGMLEALRHRHREFRALLETSLTVLATSHAVSEGIVRGVSGELTRKAAPQTYGASGRANVPSPRMAQPLAISRSL
jgi:hypothetical protein